MSLRTRASVASMHASCMMSATAPKEKNKRKRQAGMKKRQAGMKNCQTGESRITASMYTLNYSA